MTGNGAYCDWIAVDWGTSNLRVWAMGASGDVKAAQSSDKGMGGLSPDQFEPILLELIEPWLGAGEIPVVACGMVGARQGWSEAPYRAVPCTPSGDLHKVATKDARIAMHILPGLSQSKNPDVMRGEETQIAGFLAEHSDFDGVLCMPGTHSKWVHISAREIVSFQSFMTGEIFAALSSATVLRHSVQASGWDESAFQDGVALALSQPEKTASELFRLRAADLLAGTSKPALKSRLSGLLIGMELAAAKPYWLGLEIALIGDPKLTALYDAALQAQGLSARAHSGDTLTLSGLSAAYRELFQ
jgi:2-dehydro-3-deoxygalactonokinase